MEQSIFPEIRVVRTPRVVRAICERLGGVTMLPPVTDFSTSTHIKREEPDPRPVANEVIN